MTVFILYTILYSIAIAGIFIIASLVLLRQQGREHKTFALFAYCIGSWVLLQFIAQLFHEIWPEQTLIILRIAIVLSAFFSVFFYAFTRQYVGKKIAIYQHLIIPALFAVIALIPGSMFSEAVINYTGISIISGPFYYPLVIFTMLYAGLAIKGLIVSIRHNLRNRIWIYRTRFLLSGMIWAVVIITLALIVFPDALLSQLATPVAILGMLLNFAYAIIKHRLFDIRLIVTRLFAYVLSLLTLAVLYSFLVFDFIAQILTLTGNIQIQQAGNVLVALVLALTFNPLKRLFDKLTKAVFYQDAYETQQVLDKFNSVLVNTIKLHELINQSLLTLQQALKSEYLSVAILNPNKTIDRIIGTEGKANVKALAEQLKGNRAAVLIQDELINSRLKTIFQENNCSIIVKLETSKELIGYFVCGYKTNGAVYTAQDLDLIRITTDELAIAIQNALRFEEIERFNETLRLRIDKATAELKASNKKLRALDEAKDEFISMASHQLRTPLTSVKGYVSMVLEGDAGALNTDQKKLLQEAYASAQRMVYMIADFLNISRLKTGKFLLEPSTVSVPDLIREEVSQLMATAKARGITIRTRVPAEFPAMQLDETKIRQVIMNFIDNAIFYSNSGGTIILTLSEDNKQAILTVEDNGIGVPAKEQTSLFTKFFRASNARQVRPDGTGIGLFMAKMVISAHGGEMIFESQENKGSIFGFTLPLTNNAVKKQAEIIQTKAKLQ